MYQGNNDDRKEDQPLYSRLFVVCSRLTKEQDLRKAFEEYGTIEDLFMPRNRTTGESKGVAYIKYSKTSSAAAAIKNLHMKAMYHGKTIKVMVAANKYDTQPTDQYGDKYNRLFIKIPKEAQEDDISEYFSKFGNVESVFKLKDKKSGEYKGFAYVKFAEFYEAAKAFEECDKNYKPIFATPKGLKRTLDNESSCSSPRMNNFEYYRHTQNYESPRSDISSLLKSDRADFRDVLVTCTPILSEKYIYQLMNIIPGMVKCENFTMDKANGICRAQITYEDTRSAAYAVEKLNRYEFPSGEIISVRPDTSPLTKAATDLSEIVKNFKKSRDSGAELLELANAIEKASSLIKAAAKGQVEPHAEAKPSYSSVPLPLIQPKANSSRVVQRLFIVCKPRPIPLEILQDAFIRFGDFISVNMIPNKTFGFVKYASNTAAREAMSVLHGATLNGMRLSVMEADERPNTEEKLDIEQVDYRDTDTKRMKFE
ncbi:RNA-binding protein 45-like [Zerene cesonia]|uniref:RNA-binding protein 45-like n=1 Tax=Zerene cesonia TaxID=33412 RepID=UPI0018E4EF61|nr:RNA-binding protein 45-like [Zerene cesonia]